MAYPAWRLFRHKGMHDWPSTERNPIPRTIEHPALQNERGDTGEFGIPPQIHTTSCAPHSLLEAQLGLDHGDQAQRTQGISPLELSPIPQPRSRGETRHDPLQSPMYPSIRQSLLSCRAKRIFAITATLRNIKATAEQDNAKIKALYQLCPSSS